MIISRVARGAWMELHLCSCIFFLKKLKIFWHLTVSYCHENVWNTFQPNCNLLRGKMYYLFMETIYLLLITDNRFTVTSSQDGGWPMARHPLILIRSYICNIVSSCAKRCGNGPVTLTRPRTSCRQVSETWHESFHYCNLLQISVGPSWHFQLTQS